MSPGRRGSGPREWLARLALAGLGIAVGLAAAEVVVRLAAPQSVMLWRPGPFVADGEGYFRLQPGYRGEVTNRTEYRHEVRINSLGMRGAEPAPTGADGCRLLAIGDSFAFGLGVEEEEVFHQVAAGRLGGGKDGLVFLNGGIPAIGVTQAVRWLGRHGLETRPDLVLLTVFLGNDLRDANPDFDNWGVVGGQLAAPTGHSRVRDWLFNNHHLYALLKNRLPAGAQRRLRAALGMGEPWNLRYAREVFMVYDPTVPPRVAEGLARTDDAVAQLARLGEEHGFTVAAMLVPDIVQVDRARWEATLEHLGLAGADRDPRQPNRLLTATLRRHGVPVLDLLDSFDAAHDDGESLYYPIDRHWTAAGHALAGRLLAGFLEPWIVSCGKVDNRRPTEVSSVDGDHLE